MATLREMLIERCRGLMKTINEGRARRSLQNERDVAIFVKRDNRADDWAKWLKENHYEPIPYPDFEGMNDEELLSAYDDFGRELND